jgi:hypothetical protein
MMRVPVILVAIVMLAGCGSATGTDSGTSSPDPPLSSQPPWETTTSPPPASLETPDGATTLTVGSYCWMVTAGTGGTGVCADAAPFSVFKELPTVKVAEGDTVTLVLALTPSQPIEVSLGDDTMKLPAATRSEWTLTGHGILEVFATFPQGDVSYGIRIEPPAGSG